MYCTVMNGTKKHNLPVDNGIMNERKKNKNP
jgi:hypothetical protein